MFKYIAVLLSIFCAVWSQENRISLRVTTPQVLELRKCAGTCGKEFGVDPNDLRKIIDWSMPYDMPHKQFMYCIFFTSGYIAEDGHFLLEKAMQLIPINGTLGEVRQIYEDCNKVTKEDKIETMHAMGACFHAHFIPTIDTSKKS